MRIVPVLYQNNAQQLLSVPFALCANLFDLAGTNLVLRNLAYRIKTIDGKLIRTGFKEMKGNKYYIRLRPLQDFCLYSDAAPSC